MSEVENIADHMALTCQCGSVNFALLKSGLIECNSCSQPMPRGSWKQSAPPKVYVCGVTCHEGDANCNGYCTGKAPYPKDCLPKSTKLDEL